MALAVAAWCFTGRYLRGSISFILAYCCVIAVIRGDVGTDTEQYQNVFAAVAMGNQEWLFEGGFASVATILVTILPTPEMAVRAVSLIFFILLAIYSMRATDDEKWILLTYTLPVFAYQYSMNGLRIGLASAVLLLCAQSLGRGVTLNRQISLVVPIFLHYSTLISVVLIHAASSLRSLRHILFALSISSAAALGLFLLASDYLFGKGDTYQEMLAPTTLSGLARIAVIASLAVGVLLGDLKQGVKGALVFCFGALTILGLLLARESYAGLRIIDLLSFVFPLSVLICYQRSMIPADRRYMLSVLLAGCIGAVGVARNFVVSSGEGEAPFVPYQVLPWTHLR